MAEKGTEMGDGGASSGSDEVEYNLSYILPKAGSHNVQSLQLRLLTRTEVMAYLNRVSDRSDPKREKLWHTELTLETTPLVPTGKGNKKDEIADEKKKKAQKQSQKDTGLGFFCTSKPVPKKGMPNEKFKGCHTYQSSLMGFQDLYTQMMCQSYLRHNGSFELTQIVGDGACMFRSIHAQMLFSDDDECLGALITRSEESQIFTPYRLRLFTVFWMIKFVNQIQEFEEDITNIVSSLYGVGDPNMPGPFTLYDYCVMMMEPTSHGDTACLHALTMVWQAKLTVLNIDSDRLWETRYRHNENLENADLVLVYNCVNHFNAGLRPGLEVPAHFVVCQKYRTANSFNWIDYGADPDPDMLDNYKEDSWKAQNQPEPADWQKEREKLQKEIKELRAQLKKHQEKKPKDDPKDPGPDGGAGASVSMDILRSLQQGQKKLERKVGRFIKRQENKEEERLPFGEDEVVCPEDGRRFKTNAGLESHYRLFHLQKTDFRCFQKDSDDKECLRYFKDKAHLLKHMKEIHNIEEEGGAKKHKCVECGKGYSSKSALKTHMKDSHPSSDESESVSCRYCGHVPGKARYLGDHERTCSQNPNRTEYKCKYCGKISYSQRNATRHRCKKMKTAQEALFSSDDHLTEAEQQAQHVKKLEKKRKAREGASKERPAKRPTLSEPAAPDADPDYVPPSPDARPAKKTRSERKKEAEREETEREEAERKKREEEERNEREEEERKEREEAERKEREEAEKKAAEEEAMEGDIDEPPAKVARKTPRKQKTPKKTPPSKYTPRITRASSKKKQEKVPTPSASRKSTIPEEPEEPDDEAAFRARRNLSREGWGQMVKETGKKTADALQAVEQQEEEEEEEEEGEAPINPNPESMASQQEKPEEEEKEEEEKKGGNKGETKK